MTPQSRHRTPGILLGIITSAVFVLTAAANSTNCVPPPAGLVSWWPGEGNANDIVGTNNGTLYGGVGFAYGEVGQAFSFNGTNSYILVPNSASLNPTGSFSIETWVYPFEDTAAGFPLVVKWGDTAELSNQRSYGLALLPGMAVNFHLSDLAHQLDGTFQAFPTDPGAVTLRAWNHVVGVYDQSTGTRNIFVNGVLLKSRTDSPITIYNGVAPLSIGADYRGGGQVVGYFDGLVDEVSLYSRALTTNEIAALYAAGSAGKCRSVNCVPPPSGLVAWWPGEGNANDIAGTNNGTLSGGVSFTSGEVGLAFDFDGTNGTVTVPDSSSLRLTTQFTIEAWINPRSNNTDQGIVSKVGIANGNNGYQLYLSHQNMLTGQFNSPGQNWPGNVIAYTNSLAIVPDVWCHVAWTYDQSAMKLYLNGAPVATDVIGPQAIAVSSTDLRISGADTHVYFNGLIDEPSVYTRALSDGEIAAIYNAGSAGKCRLPRVATASAVVVNDFFVGATITDAGYGYTNTPTVRIIGGGGSGAQAAAVVSNGVVIAINVLAAGSGYTNTPVVVIAPPFIPNPTMGIGATSLLTFTNLTVGTNYQLQFFSGYTWSNLGSAFTATSPVYTQYVSGAADPNGYRLASAPVPSQAYATAQVVNGFVVGATVTSGGSGYGSAPMVSIVDGGGSNATAVATVSSGVITGINITSAGTGYTSVPAIIIAPPPANALVPMVTQAMELSFNDLSPYDNYQMEFVPMIGSAWSNFGSPFIPTSATNIQYVSVSGNGGFFRVRHVP